MDCDIDSQTPEIRPVPPRGGFAMFGVLVLVVVFTLLGVGALTLARRDNQNSGSVLDIKSRQSAAYAGLAFALGEFQRDPANFVALLESWRTKSVYGSPTNPLPRLYLKFDASGAAVALVKTKPAAFAIAGTPYKVVVELAGIQVPATNTADPVIVLRSTGTGRSGDEQTIVGAYRVGNVRLNVATANLGITHPFYLNGTGTWNKKIDASGGDVFFGNDVLINSDAQEIVTSSGGLKINGNLTWNTGKGVDVSGNSWITGNYSVKSAISGAVFRKSLVVDGDVAYGGIATLEVQGSMAIRGTTGLSLSSGTLLVGAGVPGSQIVVDRGAVSDATGGGKLLVTGNAYLRQLADGTKPITLNASRLELADNPAITQRFLGLGTWGRLVARRAAPGSFLRPINNNGITISKNSWNENAANLSLGANLFNQGTGSTLYYDQTVPGPCAGCAGLTTFSQTLPAAGDSISTLAGGGSVNAQRFDAAYPPKTLAELGYGVSPALETEVGFDLTKDPSIETRAFVPSGGGALCFDGSKICGASLNQAYSNSSNASCFFNGFFVVKLTGAKELTWDAGMLQTTPLSGKFLFIVTGLVNGSHIWPTTANNLDPANPSNIQFIYVKSTGNIFSGFSPRHKNDLTTPVSFYGYVRIDHSGTAGTSWQTQTPTDIQGAVHVMGDRTKANLTVNSSAGALKFNLNQGVLNAIGNAFGTVFTDPVGGAPLVNPSLAGFKAVENWIQFMPLSELR